MPAARELLKCEKLDVNLILPDFGFSAVAATILWDKTSIRNVILESGR